MQISVLPNIDIRPLDDLMIGSNGLLNVVPSGKLLSFSHIMRQVWCAKRGVYQFPTEELIHWLSKQINGRKAIEVCAGNGVIGRALGIPSTDSYMQTKPEILAYYTSLGQVPISPPKDVLRYEALEAVKHFEPNVVLGAWVTQLWREGDPEGSVEGVDELSIIKRCQYIHIGNDNSHGYKNSMRLQHQHLRFDWLVSRGQNQSFNHLGVWNNG